VFKTGLTYVDGIFRKPYINPALAQNALILKEKGLLFVEQSFQKFIASSTVSLEARLAL
jgi:hypothetical protein